LNTTIPPRLKWLRGVGLQAEDKHDVGHYAPKVLDRRLQ
jgi:hypothetical protein